MRRISPKQHLTSETINSMTREELLYYSKRSQNNLSRRRKSLQDNIEKNPGELSPYGLRELEGGQVTPTGRVKEGIPSVKSKDGINELRAKAHRFNHLNHLETTTVRGARDVQERQTRLTLGLPATGKLNADDKKMFNEAMKYNRDNPDAMSTFWQAFESFQRENLHRQLDSNQLLEEYRPVIEKARKDGYTAMQDLEVIMQEYSEEKYLEEQERRNEAIELEEGSNWR